MNDVCTMCSPGRLRAFPARAPAMYCSCRPHICHGYHGLQLGKKFCHVKKFQISVKNLNNLWHFIKIYAVFILNLCGEKMTNMRSGFPPVTVSITIYVFPIMVVTNHLCHNHLLFMEYGHNYLLSSSLQNCPHIAISKTFFKGVNLPRRCSSLQTSHNQVVAKYFVICLLDYLTNI